MMERWKEAKFAIDAFRKYTSKAQGRSSRIFQNEYQNQVKFAAFKPVQRLRFGFQTSITSSHSSSPFLLVNPGNRFYSITPQQAGRFTKKCFGIVMSYVGLVLSGFSIFVILYVAVLLSGYGIMEIVPYSGRVHLVLWSKSKERLLAEINAEKEEADYQGKILPRMHPQSVRVNLIAKNIFEALKMKLDAEKERPWKRNPTLAKLAEHINISGREESHLEGMNCEVFVTVDESATGAFCTGGKIFVSKYLLDSLEADAEIALVIGHVVGHAVARHEAEQWTYRLMYLVIGLAHFRRSIPYLLFVMSILYFGSHTYLGFEIEADYIGLMLMASAGYDPRIAPKLYERYRNTHCKLMKSLLHPSGEKEKRARFLSQPQVMKRALALYILSIYRQNKMVGQGPDDPPVPSS